MMNDFTHNILQSMKGYLDITVSHPSYAGKLIVKGAAVSGLDAPWRGIPTEMRVERTVYCCVPAWDEARDPVFVFADDVTVIDAPAYLVVGRMMDRMYERGLDIDRMMNDEDEDDIDDEAR